MPLKKLTFKPGVNKENTRYTNENGWYESEKVRFRQGTPEKIGGWTRISANTFLGICRSLWNWVTLDNKNYLGVGTNLKFYIENGGAYYDITPIRATSTINNNPFVATLNSSVLTVTDTAHGATANSFVTYSGAVGLGGNITAPFLNQEYQIATIISANSYTIIAKNTSGATVTANATDVTGSPGGGASVVAAYQVNAGYAIQVPRVGWGAGLWNKGLWGRGTTGSATSALQIWNQNNFGQNLIFGPAGGGVYYWDAALGLNLRGVNIVDLVDPTELNPPVVQNYLLISDSSRYTILFGTNDYGSTSMDPMLIRWSNQEDPLVWTPAATNSAGSLKLSHGSQIVSAVQTRQEIVVFTDSAVYSMQFLGAPGYWGSQLLGDNISIMSQSSAIVASGVVYWMGVDKFYKYDGRVQTLKCDLRQFIFDDINQSQAEQVFVGTNEGFNEVWWFYCSEDSTTIDRYVIYNYSELNGEGVWYYGTLARTAWLDSGLRTYPMAATYLNNVVYHENGNDDNSTATPTVIESTISSAEFDIDDGDKFGFIRRVVPDITFRGSTGDATPQVTMTLIPMQNSGSGANDPRSVGGESYASIQRIATAPIEEFTGQIFIRVRGRQMILQIDCNTLGTQWQLGSPRIDIKQDGGRGNS
jgi:hypothetical protein